MIRMLVIAIACAAGALVTWFFIPTIPMGDASTPSVQEQKADPDGPRLIKAPMMSEAKRRTRAEQVVGDELRYATGKDIKSVAWFKEQKMSVIERAMDECYMVLDPLMYAEHVHAVRGDEIESGNVSMQTLFPRASFRQAMACKNVFVAYSELHGKKINF